MASPSPARVFETLRAFQETGALRTAIELGVFTAIAEGARTAAEIASKCGASERGTRILCDCLAVSELLTKTDGKYDNTPDSNLFLNRHSPAYMGTVADFISSPEMMNGFLGTLTDCVRKGGTMLPDEGSVSHENPLWINFARSMAPLMAPAAAGIAAHLPAAGPLKVLDIAAGHGMFGIAVAKRNAQAEITAVDWAPVLEVATENAAKAGVSARHKTIAGSAFDVEFGSGYDVVLLTNFLHHFDVPTCEGLLRKIHSALKPGGKVVTLEFVPDENRISPPVPARFAITMLFSTVKGDAYIFKELDSMLRHAGFESNVQHLLETQQSVIISTK
ncbi:MAG TPA: class I SAM-dependent methyltransferase [Bryobacteraceae bacterium]|nr:class I SAM-dependent methyltransferase [Bryobacteraceae bacterium]